MTHTTITTERKIPNPEKDGYYWYKKQPGAAWEPVLVSAATKTWPACINDMHSTNVADLSGEWGDYIPFPDEQSIITKE